jgi:selenide,water dikinase
VASGARVARVEAGGVALADGRREAADAVLWATGAAPPAWLAGTGLALDAAGWIAVDESLRSLSHSFVFAAGDAAAVRGHPREKAGVFAVRQGPLLAENLRRAALGRRLRRRRPQAKALALIGTGDGRAVAARGAWAAEGRLALRLKDRIDRRWIEGYQRLS